MNNNHLAVVCVVICAVALALGLVGSSLFFGLAVVSIIALLAALGFGFLSSSRTVCGIAVFGCLFCLLVYLSHAMHRPNSDLTLFLGFPTGTAPLVYGVGPVGLILGVLYALSFDGEVLPDERRRAFLERFGNRK